jgi:hypothetical protein
VAASVPAFIMNFAQPQLRWLDARLQQALPAAGSLWPAAAVLQHEAAAAGAGVPQQPA